MPRARKRPAPSAAFEESAPLAPTPASTPVPAPVVAVKKEEEQTEIAWVALEVPPSQLRVDLSLTNGQTFAWRAAGDSEWRGVIDGVLVSLRQTDSDTLARTCTPCSWPLIPRLREYFHLHEDLQPLYARWASGHERLAAVAVALPGLRVIRQEPVECLFSFICSSNNNIARIQTLVDKLRRHFGQHLAEDYWAFPSLEALAAIKEEQLRDLGFGYRANFVVSAARQVIERGGAEWLRGLREQPRVAVQKQLVELAGVGNKVADCVALFSLDKHDVAPVDTHVLQIAQRDFEKCMKLERLNGASYTMIGECFRDAFGPHAGWAHSLLFAAELKQHAWRLPPSLQVQAPKKGKKKIKTEEP